MREGAGLGPDPGRLDAGADLAVLFVGDALGRVLVLGRGRVVGVVVGDAEERRMVLVGRHSLDVGEARLDLELVHEDAVPAVRADAPVLCAFRPKDEDRVELGIRGEVAKLQGLVERALECPPRRLRRLLDRLAALGLEGRVSFLLSDRAGEARSLQRVATPAARAEEGLDVDGLGDGRHGRIALDGEVALLDENGEVVRVENLPAADVLLERARGLRRIQRQPVCRRRQLRRVPRLLAPGERLRDLELGILFFFFLGRGGLSGDAPRPSSRRWCRSAGGGRRP